MTILFKRDRQWTSDTEDFTSELKDDTVSISNEAKIEYELDILQRTLDKQLEFDKQYRPTIH